MLMVFDGRLCNDTVNALPCMVLLIIARFPMFIAI